MYLNRIYRLHTRVSRASQSVTDCEVDEIATKNSQMRRKPVVLKRYFHRHTFRHQHSMLPFLIVFFAATNPPAIGTFIAQSTLEACINDGSENALPSMNNETCEKKLVVAMTIAAGDSGTSQIQTIVDSVVDANGTWCY